MKRVNSMKLIPALMLVAFSGAASASGFQLLEQNASGIGNAFAGSAAVAENAGSADKLAVTGIDRMPGRSSITMNSVRAVPHFTRVSEAGRNLHLSQAGHQR